MKRKKAPLRKKDERINIKMVMFSTYNFKFRSSKIEVERRENYHFFRLEIQLRNVLTRINM